jgi:hypothetical protein
MAALRADLRPAPTSEATLDAWAAWDLKHGILERKLDVSSAFDR